MLTGKRLEYLADLLPENVSWGDPLNAIMLDQILAAQSAGAQEPVGTAVNDMQLTEEQIESIYESCHDKWLDSGKCINLWHTFAKYLLAAHNTGAQEPVGTAVNDEELGRFWEMHKPASEFPVGTHAYTRPQPPDETGAARDVHALRTVRAELGLTISDPMWAEHAEVNKRALRRWHSVINAEIERIDYTKGK